MSAKNDGDKLGWGNKAAEIEKIPRFLRRGMMVTILYRPFQEVTVKGKFGDQKMMQLTYLEAGKERFLLVNNWDFAAIAEKFAAQKYPESIVYAKT